MYKSYRSLKAVSGSAQRAVFLALGVAFSLPLSAIANTAHSAGPLPTMMMAGQGQSFGHGPSFGQTTLFRGHTAAPHAAVGQQAHNLFQAAGANTNWHNAANLNHLFARHHGGESNLHSTAAAGANLNLSSAQQAFLIGNLGNFSSLVIDVGGRQEVVSLNTKLTAAELVAVEQVLTGSGQSIILGAGGTAKGGSISLNNELFNALNNSVGGSIASLTISRGVQVVDSLSTLSFSGRLANYGTLLTASNASGNTDRVLAGTIVNGSGANIGTYTGGTVGGDPLVGADVALTAINTLTNAGTISSAHVLNISAPNIENTGLISAGSGNINVAGNSALNITGAGKWQANNGNINFAAANSNINVADANLSAQQFNFNAGTGDVLVTLGDLSGKLNATGCKIEIGANSGLDLGKINAIGDPLFFSPSTITLTTISAAGEPASVVSGQDIISASGVTIDTSNPSGNGGNITLIAGAKFVPPASKANGVALKVTGGSLTGGTIDLTGGSGPVNSITSAATGATGNGGNILMVAYAGPLKGEVRTPTTGVISTSSLNGAGGNVTMIGPGNVSALSSITTSGANSSSKSLPAWPQPRQRALSVSTMVPPRLRALPQGQSRQGLSVHPQQPQ